MERRGTGSVSKARLDQVRQQFCRNFNAARTTYLFGLAYFTALGCAHAPDEPLGEDTALMPLLQDLEGGMQRSTDTAGRAATAIAAVIGNVLGRASGQVLKSNRNRLGAVVGP